MSKQDNHDIAIIGMACRLPGAPNYQAYWDLLAGNQHAIQEIPRERWDVSEYYSSDFDAAGKSISKWGGLVDHIEQFDHRYFNITPKEAASMDAQQRLLLQEAVHCIEDSGVSLQMLRNSITSVYIGVMAIDHYANTVESNSLNAYSCLGSYGCILSNRISNYFGFKGESITIDTACSSSLVALHHARNALLSGECDYALVGGVSTIQHPFRYISFSKARMLSPDGLCKTFDASANGYVPGEGAGLVLLQRTADALEKRHSIHAKVCGTAVNHSGAGLAITAPKVSAQQEVICSAMRAAGIHSEKVSYVEAHGTGTSLGDPIEVEALTKAFMDMAAGEQQPLCKIGSVKSNIGHLEAAAGVAGLIKLVLMMKHRMLVKTLHVNEPNPIIDFIRSPFRLALENEEWTGVGGQLIAGLSSFGFGGVNAHAILEHAPQKESVTAFSETLPFLVSAHSVEALRHLCQNWLQVLLSPPAGVGLDNLLMNSILGRPSWAFRKAWKSMPIEQLTEELRTFAGDENSLVLPARGIKEKPLILVASGFTDAENWPVVAALFRANSMLVEKVRQFGVDPALPEAAGEFALVIQLLTARSWLEELLSNLPEVQMVGGDEAGVFCAWSIAAGISPDEMIDVILRKNIPAEFSDRLRRYRLWIGEESRIVHPLDWGADFFEDAFHSDISEHELNFVLLKSRALWHNQFSFKRFVLEWVPDFNTGFGLDALLILEKNHTPSGPAAKALALLLVYSLKRVYVKWDLQGVIKLGQPSLDMMVQLLILRRLTVPQVLSILQGRKDIVIKSEPGDILMFDQTEACRQDFIPGFPSGKNSECMVPAEEEGLAIHPPWFNPPYGFPFKGTESLARLWEMGYTVNWKAALHCEYMPASIPVFYPFPGMETKREDKLPVPVKLASRYKRHYTISGDPLIASHQLCGQTLLPAAAMIENACIASSEFNAGNNQTVGRFQFLHPCIFRQMVDLEWEISSQGFVFYKNTKAVAAGRWVPSGSRVDKPVLSAEWFATDGRNLYDFLKKSGYQYGLPLQVVEKLSEHQEGFSFTMRTTNSVTAMIDGAFHCMLWAGSRWKSLLLDGQSLMVPFMLKRVTIWKEIMPGEARVILLKENMHFNGAQFKAVITIWQNDELVAELEDSVFQLVRNSFLAEYIEQEEKDNAPCLALRPVWKKISPQMSDDASWPAMVLLLPEGETAIAGEQAIGETFYWSSTRSWISVLQAWLKTNQNNRLLIRILNPAQAKDVEGSMDLLYNFSRLCLELFQGIMESRNRNAITVQLLLHQEVGCIEGDRPGAFSLAALEGIAQCLLTEKPQLFFQLIDSDSPDTMVRLKEAAKAFDFTGKRPHLLCFRNGEPICREFQIMQVAGLDWYLPGEQDTVLVVGGAGGIGWKTVLFIQEHSNARIIIAGRKKRADLPRDILLQLEQNPRFQYECCNSSDSNSVIEMFERIQKQGVRIQVFIHAAGVLEDKFLLSKEWNSFSRVLDAKVKSMHLLHQQLQLHPLKYCIAYSSAVTMSGNMGQADYATANAFLNHWCAYMQQLYPSRVYRSVNWTVWEDTGMASGKIAGDHLNKIGLEPIHPEKGLHALAALVSQPSSVVYALSTGSSFSVMLPAMQDIAVAPEPQPELITKPLMNNQSIKLGIARILELSETDIDDDLDLRHYGVDSVLITRIVNMLGAMYGEEHVYPSLLMEYPSIDALKAYFEAIAPLTQPPVSIPAASSQVSSATYPGTAAELVIPAINQPRQGTEARIKAICQIIADVIELRAEDIEPGADLREYGIDSVSITVMTDKLGAHFGNEMVYPSLLMEYNSVAALADYFVTAVRDEEQAVAELQPATQPVTMPQKPVQEFPGRHQDNDIAIIGFHCRFPQSPDPEAFWSNLIQGKDCITRVPAMRWDTAHFYNPARLMNKSYTDRGGFIDGIDLFDNVFFGISDEEALQMDPQQRLFLELTQELLDRSGYRREELRHSAMGIFIGANESNYGRKYAWRNKYYGKQGVVNTVSNLIAGRIADFYDFTGPAQVVYTACSSSFVALHNACLALKNGDCEAAIAGGIELLVDEEWFIGFSNSQALSPDACSRVFDTGANGFVLSEGLGAVLLKPLGKALQDGDQIMGVIRASTINNDGSTMGLTTPSLNAQKDLIRKALRQSGVSPSSISYYEAHGTGTPLGDPTEIKAASEVYREFSTDKQWCALGSVKSNIGHTLSAAGMAGLIKILLSFRHRILPPTLNCNNPHQRFQFEQSPFFPNTNNREWKAKEGVWRAAVSSFGFGGTNVHLILEAFDDASRPIPPLRKPLGATKFNKQSFWLSEIHAPEMQALKDLLDKLSRQATSVDEAETILKTMNLA